MGAYFVTYTFQIVAMNKKATENFPSTHRYFPLATLLSPDSDVPHRTVKP